MPAAAAAPYTGSGYGGLDDAIGETGVLPSTPVADVLLFPKPKKLRFPVPLSVKTPGVLAYLPLSVRKGPAFITFPCGLPFGFEDNSEAV